MKSSVVFLLNCKRLVIPSSFLLANLILFVDGVLYYFYQHTRNNSRIIRWIRLYRESIATVNQYSILCLRSFGERSLDVSTFGMHSGHHLRIDARRPVLIMSIHCA